MGLLTYLQQVSSRLMRSRVLRSLPRYTLEELGLGELERTAAELPSFTLHECVDLVSDVPLPTQQRKENLLRGQVFTLDNQLYFF